MTDASNNTQFIDGFKAHLDSVKGRAEARTAEQDSSFKTLVKEKTATPEGLREYTDAVLDFVCGNFRDNLDDLFEFVTWAYNLVKA